MILYIGTSRYGSLGSMRKSQVADRLVVLGNAELIELSLKHQGRI